MGLPEEKTTNVAQRIQQKFWQSCGAKDEKLKRGEAKIQQDISGKANTCLVLPTWQLLTPEVAHMISG